MLRRSFFKWATLALLLIVLLPCLFGNVSAQSASEDTSVDAGSLRVLEPNGKPGKQCPLKHTEVKADISGFLSRVTVTQEFTNPFPDKIEAVYTFPLPQAAAVDDMTMLIGDRIVKGKIMRREEAQATYAAAKQMGKVASLLDQERPNIFTQAVANIMPGQEIRITISYVETLQYEDGVYEWSFPMVVGERYIPDSVQPDDSSRIIPPRASRAGHDLSLEINLNAGVPIQSLNSETHETEIERTGDNAAVVRLKDRATIPNKDFVLKYQVAGNVIDDALLAHRTDRGGFFTLILQPPQRVSAADVMPKELVFVLDSSGSMSGFPFEKARETLLLALDNLYPHDTFNVITFAGETRILFSDPVPATPENIRKAKKLLSRVGADGGTEMMKAIKAALDPSDSQQHVRIACFMTDGQVGDDEEIIAEVQKHPNARVFAMGFSDSPNRYLLDKIAEYGRGEVEYVQEQGDTSAVARRFHERVRNPLLTDLSIDWSDLPVSDVYPKRLPDLFSAKPVIISGRYSHGGKGTIRLRGRVAGQEFVREVPIELPNNEPAHDVLAILWARRRIDDVMGQFTAVTPGDSKRAEHQEEVTQLGLNFRLMTQFTSFVAVDELVFTGSEAPERVDVPVEAAFAIVSPGFVAALPLGMTGYVTVTASADQVQEFCAGGITTRTHQELPLQGRSLNRLVSLAPGTVWPGGNAGGLPTQVNISANGQTTASNMFRVDGVSANFGIAPGGQSPGPSAAGTAPALTASGGTSSVVSLAAVSEVTVTTRASEAEYGRLPGAQVNAITRSGTNALHGSLFYFFGNNGADANDWFANSRNLPKPPRRLHNFGGTLDGPVVKDKTFFFGSYEGLRLRQPATAITDVPALNARQSAPETVRPFLNAFPIPNGNATGDGLAEFAATFANPARHDVASLRLDHVLNNEAMLAVRYNFADSDATTRGAGGFSLNTVNRIHSRSQTITASLTQTLSPTKVLELHGNYSRSTVGGSYLLDQFGGAMVPSEFLNTGDSSFAFDLNARAASLMSGSDATNTQRQFNFVGSLAIVSGNHEFKFGADYRRLAPIIVSRAREKNVLFNDMTEALTGIPARLNQLEHITPQTPVFNNLSLYAQDEWRQSPRFTLNYGARWELTPAPVNPISGFRLWETTYANFAPRLGFAYQVSAKDEAELILRGNIGVHYDLGQELEGDAFVDSVPFLGGTSVSTASVLPGGNNLPFIDFNPHLKLPYTLNWDVSLQRALGQSQTVSASYVASTGRRLLSTQTFFDSDPQFPFLRRISNQAESNYRSLQLQFERRLASGLKSSVSYSWARSTDDANRDTARRVLLASLNPEADRGYSDFDVRHTLNGFVSYDLPAPFSTGLGNRLLRNWTIESLFMARSAKPVNVLYGFPTSYGFAYVRPDVVDGAFVLPTSFRQGNLSRNSLRGFPFYQIDLALHRKFAFSERTSLQFQADAFNLFNHPNFEDPAGDDLHLPTFGQSTALAGSGFESFYTAGGARTLRFSVKLAF
ncbi:MAG TPA: VIT domain-containing protein [Pyrinomonadaceae bacterium]|jgi:Ca-activated chloride channel family protein